MRVLDADEKRAMYAQLYGCDDIRVALMVGVYPPPDYAELELRSKIRMSGIAMTQAWNRLGDK